MSEPCMRLPVCIMPSWCGSRRRFLLPLPMVRRSRLACLSGPAAAARPPRGVRGRSQRRAAQLSSAIHGAHPLRPDRCGHGLSLPRYRNVIQNKHRTTTCLLTSIDKPTAPHDPSAVFQRTHAQRRRWEALCDAALTFVQDHDLRVGEASRAFVCTPGEQAVACGGVVTRAIDETS